MERDRKTICYLIDDEPKALSMFERLISLVEPDWEVASFTSARDLIQQSEVTPPDVLFTDIEMPDISGFKLLEQFRKKSIFPVTVFVTGYDHYAIKAIKESVLDYLVKPVDIDELEETVKRIKSKLNAPILADHIDRINFLTQAEKEVLKLLAKGYTSPEAAKILNCSPNTVNTHRNHILQKTGCKTILEALNDLQE